MNITCNIHDRYLIALEATVRVGKTVPRTGIWTFVHIADASESPDGEAESAPPHFVGGARIDSDREKLKIDTLDRNSADLVEKATRDCGDIDGLVRDMAEDFLGRKKRTGKTFSFKFRDPEDE